MADITSLFQFLKLIRVFKLIGVFKRRSVKRPQLWTELVAQNGRPVVLVGVENASPIPLVIHHVRLPALVYTSRQPRLAVPPVLQRARVLDDFLSPRPEFASDAGLDLESFPQRLAQGDRAHLSIDLDASVEHWGNQYEFIPNIALLGILVAAHVEIETSASTFSVMLHRDARYYLWKRLSEAQKMFLRF